MTIPEADLDYGYGYGKNHTINIFSMKISEKYCRYHLARKEWIIPKVNYISIPAYDYKMTEQCKKLNGVIFFLFNVEFFIICKKLNRRVVLDLKC